jgi:hypothetical protein
MSLKILAAIFAVSLSAQCTNSQIVRNPDQDGFAVIQFPKPFKRADSTIIISETYEVRQLSGQSGNQLAFAMKDDDGTYGSAIFGVDLEKGLKVDELKATDWARARSLPDKRYDPFAHETKVEGDAVLFHGKRFPRTGQSWESTDALASPNGRWLAVFSHTSEKDLPSYGVLGGGGRGKGEMFVDVYDTNSGKKIHSTQMPHRGGDQPGRFFNNSVWIEDKYLVIPIDTEPREQVGSSSPGDRILLATMPDK